MTLSSLKSDIQRNKFLMYLEDNFKKELTTKYKGTDCMKTFSLVTKDGHTGKVPNNFFQYRQTYLKYKDRIEGILTKHATYTSDERKNPNSGNMIKLWVF